MRRRREIETGGEASGLADARTLDGRRGEAVPHAALGVVVRSCVGDVAGIYENINVLALNAGTCAACFLPTHMK